MRASHSFKQLDARGVLSVDERTRTVGRVRALAGAVARTYIGENGG